MRLEYGSNLGSNLFDAKTKRLLTLENPAPILCLFSFLQTRSLTRERRGDGTATNVANHAVTAGLRSLSPKRQPQRTQPQPSTPFAPFEARGSHLGNFHFSSLRPHLFCALLTALSLFWRQLSKYSLLFKSKAVFGAPKSKEISWICAKICQ